eukprot:5030907-Amphidinium_carterae.1
MQQIPLHRQKSADLPNDAVGNSHPKVQHHFLVLTAHCATKPSTPRPPHSRYPKIQESVPKFEHGPSLFFNWCVGSSKRLAMAIAGLLGGLQVRNCRPGAVMEWLVTKAARSHNSTKSRIISNANRKEAGNRLPVNCNKNSIPLKK